MIARALWRGFRYSLSPRGQTRVRSIDADDIFAPTKGGSSTMHRFAHAALFLAGVSAAVVAGPLLDHSITSVTADGQGSHTVTTDKTSTTTQSGIADSSGQSSGRLTVRQIDPNSTDATLNGRYDQTGQGTGHFVIGNDVCSGQCPTP
jgi:hypothetical protein